jgi:polyphenol oxidase
MTCLPGGESSPYLCFAQLSYPGLEHVFTLRNATEDLKKSCRDTLASISFPCDHLIEAEQPHGNQIARVGLQDSGKTIPAVDGLITNEPGVTLGIRTADCGPLFLYDPENKAIGVVHSGKKGTQAGILSVAIRAMNEAYQTDPRTLIVVLGPCIRPPHYDLDFAQTIQEQALDSGMQIYHDCGHNTGADLSRFYSYRVELGQTGRHYAAMRLLPQ